MPASSSPSSRAWRSSTSPTSTPTSRTRSTAPRRARVRHVHRRSTCPARARARASRSRPASSSRADLTLGGAYTYTDARDPDGERELRRPPHAGKADVAYAFIGGRGTATLGAIYNGRMEDIAFQLPFFFPTAARAARRLLAAQCHGLLQAAAGRGGVRAGGESARSALSRGVRLRVRRRLPPMRASS